MSLKDLHVLINPATTSVSLYNSISKKSKIIEKIKYSGTS